MSRDNQTNIGIGRLAGHDFDVHDLLITAAFHGSFNVLVQVTSVHK